MTIRSRLRVLWLAAFVAIAAGPPAQADCDARKPVLYLAFSSDTQSALEMTDFVDRIRSHLKNLPGVADVAMFGDRRPVLRIRLDPSRLAAVGLDPQDVEEALQRQGIALPAGRADPTTIELRDSEIGPRPPNEIGDVVLSQDGDYSLRLLDVAEITFAIGDAHTSAQYAGRDVVALGVINQPDTGVLPLWYAMHRTLATIRPMMPPGMQVELLSPFSIFIQRTSGE